jgi:hypothetical protein
VNGLIRRNEMTLKENEYEIQNDGIWISRTVLEELYNHYRKLCEAEGNNGGAGWYYMER